MRVSKFWVIVAASVALVSSAYALPGYSFVSNQPDYQIPLGQGADVTIYLVEQLSAGQISLIAADNGLFSAGLAVTRDGPPAGAASILGFLADPGFDGTVLTSPAGMSGTLYEDHSSGFGPGAMPDGLGLIRLGEVHISSGASIGQVTTFHIADDSVLTSNTITYAGHALDDNPGIDPTAFTVTTIVPEPAGLGILGMGAFLGMVRRRAYA